MRFLNLKLAQRGYALLFLTGLISILGIGVLLDYMNLNFFMQKTNLSAEIDETLLHEKILFDAKNAIKGYALYGNSNTPGIFNYPDRLTQSTPTYSGKQNNICYNLSQNDSIDKHLQYCLGRIPYAEIGFNPTSIDKIDPKGLIPWYAVSLPLVNPIFKPLNPVTLRQNSFDAFYKTTHVDYVSSLFGTRKPLLKIFDENQNLLTDQAVAVIILPNKALSHQIRQMPLSGKYPDNLNHIQQYLETSNFELDDQFVKYTVKSSTHNDKLIYITLDEIIPLMERRVLNEAERNITDYWNNQHFYANELYLNQNQQIIFISETKPFNSSIEWKIISKFDNKNVMTLPKVMADASFTDSKEFLTGNYSASQTECTFDDKIFTALSCVVTISDLPPPIIQRKIYIKNKISSANNLKAKILQNGFRTLNTISTYNSPDYVLKVEDTLQNIDGSTQIKNFRYYGTSIDLTLKIQDFPRMPIWYSDHDWNKYLFILQNDHASPLKFKLNYIQ